MSLRQNSPSRPSPRLTLIEVEDIPKSREDDEDFEAAIIRVCRDYKRRVVKFMPEDFERVVNGREVVNHCDSEKRRQGGNPCALTNFASGGVESRHAAKATSAYAKAKAEAERSPQWAEDDSEHGCRITNRQNPLVAEDTLTSSQQAGVAPGPLADNLERNALSRNGGSYENRSGRRDLDGMRQAIDRMEETMKKAGMINP